MTPWRFVLWLWRCPTCVSLNELVLLVVIKMSSAQAAEKERLALCRFVQLRYRQWLPRIAILLLLVGSSSRAEEQPTLVPTRDVDITYKINRPAQPTFTERVRWSASENLERVDGPHKLTTIFGRNGTEITVTLLDREARTYRAVTRTGNYSKAAPRWPIQPERGAVLKREGESMVAAQHCTEWSWAVDTEIHILCGTPDGVLLRLVINGNTTVEATSVSYRQQLSKVFEVPPGYAPALEQAP